ncbi:structural maintenance of chromosomes flexible hinge domain-containing protein GMI1-like isoform X2 [Apium graveolens]|uniref:structural maintenance of chromosomes flexible hinge domain-containing protein GMI1-like isoform X2 n=1 Tax=Apium graveolens TaxID=4045 RepID=UPI003D78FE57
MDSTSYNRTKRRASNDNFPVKKMKCLDLILVEKVYKFRVLLPNGLCLSMRVVDPPGNQMPVVILADMVKDEYNRMKGSEKVRKRSIDWDSPDLCFFDIFENRIKGLIDLESFETDKVYTLRLCDGAKEDEIYENMWDLTPDVELLRELPQEYAFETALADLIDNSLQAIWSNNNRTRLISVDIGEDKISVFDNGPGMDLSEENSIVKWGKMGSSLHRSSRRQAIGGKPPYLKPFFGMFGYGGSISSMHLGRTTVISSKTKNSKKVCTLYLQRDALLSSSGSDKTWQANGGLRKPLKDEMKLSPDGSFTKVEISELKMKSLDVDLLRCKLKDIYFPYIQCDDLSTSGRTLTPIKFQVNGIDLAEIEGGEDSPSQRSPGQGACQEANAQLKCIYFPIVQGKESIEKVLEQLEAQRCGVAESFESFSHVSIRCLGRLLPDARWAWLPFMEPKPRKVEKAQILKRCCSRVKCFIETDGGFYPTPSKTDLMHQHPYTIALKNFGSKPSEKERDVHVEVYKDGKKLSLQQMEKQYQEWILQMHYAYDEDSDCGEDEPIIILNPSSKKQLGISSDVIRVHKLIRRKGKSWRAGQKVKVLKGACSGVHKNNIYAVLEYILLDGFQGDAGGESRIICRQMGEEKGCLVENKNGNPTIDIRESKSLPISIIDSGKCLSVETAEWSSQLEKLQQKIPTWVDILCARHCEELDVEEALPFDTPVVAGYACPDEVIAVVRPASFNRALNSENLDQKQIALTNSNMVLEIKFIAQDQNLQENNCIRSFHSPPLSRKGFRGLYIFQVKSKLIFDKAGEYTFAFHIKDSNFKSFVKGVRVNAHPQIKRWGLVSDAQCEKPSVRVGSCFPQISIACYDVYGNRTSFSRVPKVIAKVLTSQDVLFQSETLKPHLSSQNSVLTVENLLVESYELDVIRPRYEAKVMICSEDELFDVIIPCQVIPGSIHHLNAKPKDFMKQLLPGTVVQELELEVFDAYGNHVANDSEIWLNVDGFSFQQKANRILVDNRGCIDLSGLLKVSTGFGEAVSLSVLAEDKVVFREQSQTEERMIRVATEIPESCLAGSQLENLVFEIVNSDGVVDETINDNEKGSISHTLVLKSESTEIDDSVRYRFHCGCCTVRAIPLPQIEGRFSFTAAHSGYPKLNMTITVLVEKAPEIVYDSRQTQYADEEIFFHENSSDLKTPKVKNDDRSIVLVTSPDSAKNIGNIVGSVFNKEKELKDKLLEYGRYVGEHEKNLKALHAQRLELEQALSKMQASLDPVSARESSYSPEKERMLEEIELMGHTAASVICKISKNKKACDISKDIVGVVALLGNVKTNELGRILAEFLGEEQMLGVVCKSYKAAYNLETCDVDGSVNCSTGLQALASECSISLDGRYSVLCLEDTRPYEGDYNRGDPQRMLLLPNPTLPNGNSPPGFIGFAVNMIYLDANHLYTRTSGGKGLRETLFYHLLGEVQVYKTRETMKKSLEKSCIQHGAVSLDGGIIRGNGVISLGRGKPSIHFPVLASQSQNHCSSNTSNMRIQRLIETKKSMLQATIDKIDKENETCEQDKKMFEKYRDKYSKFLDEKGSLLRYFNEVALNSPS